MFNVRNLTVAAMLTSIGYVFLCASSLAPTGRLAFLCLATAALCIVVMECGRPAGVAATVVLIVLSYFFVPNNFIKIIFILFFSYYPLIKSFVERGEGLVMEWTIKVFYFAIIIFICACAAKYMNAVPNRLSLFASSIKRTALLYVIMVIAGCVFDFALSILIDFYGRFIMPKTNKNVVSEIEFEDEYDEENDDEQ